MEAFLSNASASAYEEMIDGLLASRHYGERWARYWLDLARFAEDQAHTFQARMYPQGYLYRDWVVNALNDDMPYDQFLRLQIVGDQVDIPEPHRHRAALGLFALGPVYYQDNGEQEKAQADEWDDRIDVLMRGTQALTVSCARCHDHKYDPVSMSDYYGLAGFFASSEYRELPAVSADVVAARQKADLAVQEQQVRIETLLATHAPKARLKLVSKIPEYLTAAWAVMSSREGDHRKLVQSVAKKRQLNEELLQRWVSWLNQDAGSGATHAERPYFEPFRQFVADAKSSESDEDASAPEKFLTVAAEFEQLATRLIPHREALQRRFGDNYAFVSENDRVKVEPGTIPLGNLFDDKKGARLTSALSSDPFKSRATNSSLGVQRILQGWGGTAEIAPNVRFDFGSIGSDKRQHGTITNDGWSADGGIRTQGKKCGSSLGRTEQGIGLHANALITFDLSEIRRAALISSSQPMSFHVDRAGINDDAFGSNGSVHIAVIVSRPQSKPSEFDAILGAYLNGHEAAIEENDAVYSFAGPMPPAIGADGRFVAFDVPIPADAVSLTIAVTGAQISETENTISSDHAVLSNARLQYAADEPQLVEADSLKPHEQLSEAEERQLSTDALLLSELFDERGVFGLADSQIEPLLDVEPARVLTEQKKVLEELKNAAQKIQVPMAHAITDGTPRDVRIYHAGDPKKKGETAPRAFPAIFTAGRPAPIDAEGSGRRQLADAVASSSNPLTARVMANRVWAGHFGTGLVRTLSNFGQLGERPSHPELLDYLAVRLMESGWSLKSLHREILLSATYQQNSRGDAANRETDPDNRLLWRMNRRRLEVEPWRDAVLAVSGQLNREVGGPSSELNGNHRRRTLYGAVSRHRLNDLLRLFDFPDPNITAGERSVTTVPLQQLFVLNSDFMIAQARSLAARLKAESSSDDDLVVRSFALLYGRPPSENERKTSAAFLQQSSADSEDKLAVLEQYCLAMLGTNEFAYID